MGNETRSEDDINLEIPLEEIIPESEANLGEPGSGNSDKNNLYLILLEILGQAECGIGFLM